MKPINIEDYNEIEQKDLIELSAHLNSLIQKREKEIIKAIIEKDLDALKIALRFNEDKTLSRNAWREVNFGDMAINHLDFFLYISSLPEYEFQDSRGQLLTKTGTAIYAALHDDKLFDFFLEEPKYDEILKKIVFEYGLSESVPKENIKKLFDKKFISLNDSLINTILFENRTNYLEYLIENKLVEIPRTELEKIYLKNWHKATSKFLSLIGNNFKDISLNNLINKLEVTKVFKSPFYDKYKFFVKLDDDIFLRTIKHHSVTNDEIRNLISTFNKLSPNEDKKFHKFVDLMVNNFPEYAATLKEHDDLIDPPFSVEYEKAINYVELNIDLEKANKTIAKKMKI